MTERASQAGVRPSLVVAVYLVPIESDRVLLARRKNTGYADGMYSLVAGHVESGETLTVAMIREAREEAGISIEASELTLAHTLIGRRKPYRLLLYRAAGVASSRSENPTNATT